MLTANGKALCKLNNNDSRANNSNLYFINTENVQTSRGAASPSSKISLTYLINSLRLAVGTGTDAPVSTDYSLTNENIDMTVLASYKENSNGNYNQNYIGMYSTTFRNDTENDVIVSEVGIMGDGDDHILIARDVIDPVTIAPGEAYTFTMYIG